MCVLIAVNQLGFGAVIPVLPLYAKSFGVSQTAIGATVAVYGLARVFLGIPTGQVADLLGRRHALAIGGVVTVLGNLWCATATTYVELLLARLVAGAGAGIVLTAGLIVLADITTVANRGRMLAIYQGVFLFAVGIGPFPGGFLAERFAPEAPFLVYAVKGALVTAVAWFGVAETREQRHDSAAPGRRSAAKDRRAASRAAGELGVPACLPDWPCRCLCPNRRPVQHCPGAGPGSAVAVHHRDRLRLRLGQCRRLDDHLSDRGPR